MRVTGWPGISSRCVDSYLGGNHDVVTLLREGIVNRALNSRVCDGPMVLVYVGLHYGLASGVTGVPTNLVAKPSRRKPARLDRTPA